MKVRTAFLIINTWPQRKVVRLACAGGTIFPNRRLVVLSDR
jgi:hypothetical protein